MKILYIIPEFNEGGAEYHLLNLIRGLAARHEITLATNGGTLESLLPENVKIIHVESARKNIFTIIYAALKLARLNKKFCWDIIHVHSRVPAWVAWLLSSLTGIKWLMTAHALYSLNLGLTPLKHADGVICVSESVKAHLQKYLPDKNVKIIYNGINQPENFNNSSQESTIKFLFVGRLTGIKGLDIAIKALVRLVKYKWTLDIIGEGSKREELYNLVKNLNLSDRVTFHGAKSKSQVNLFMSKSSCLLFPSLSEGMGLSVLEAASMRLPVIASDLPALREISEGGLVKTGDVDEWQKAIKNFIESRKASQIDSTKILPVNEMTCLTEKFYLTVINHN